MRLFLMVFVIALALYALIDCVRTPEEDMPARMPKHLWITLILMFSTIMLGPLAWIITSRVSAAEKRGGQLSGGLWSAEKGVDLHLSRHASAPAAPDDDPDFLRKLDEQVQAEKRRRQREQLQQNRSQRPRPAPTRQATNRPANPLRTPQSPLAAPNLAIPRSPAAPPKAATRNLETLCSPAPNLAAPPQAAAKKKTSTPKTKANY